MDIEVYYQREDKRDHSLGLVVPIYCRLRRSLDTLETIAGDLVTSEDLIMS